MTNKTVTVTLTPTLIMLISDNLGGYSQTWAVNKFDSKLTTLSF